MTWFIPADHYRRNMAAAADPQYVETIRVLNYTLPLDAWN
jgi:hypothetical protein